MKKQNFCHLLISTGGLENRVFREVEALSQCNIEQTVIMPEGGNPWKSDNYHIITYQSASRLGRIIKCYLLALKMRARVYHLHDPELLILGWCIRLFTSAAIIYDAHRPTFHYFLWKFGSQNLYTRFKAAALKLIEVIGVIFIDGLIVAAPQTMKNIGRFCARKIEVFDYPELRVSTGNNRNNDYNLIHRGIIGKKADLDLLLEVYFQLRQEVSDARLIISSRFEEDLLPEAKKIAVEMSLENIVFCSNESEWRSWAGENAIGLSLTTENDFFQRSQQPEILEFMAMGLPVVCGLTPFTEAVVADGETGLIYREYHPLPISETIFLLWRDKQVFRELGKNGLIDVERKFNWSLMSGCLCNFYRQVYKI